MEILMVVYLIINIIGVVLMKVDKQRAIKHKYRIPEKTLWLTALFGGAVGTTIGMQIFRHKIKHLSFKIGFPFLAVVEVILFIYLFTI
ncbi:DUF1294 domain-containing protein [Neobacillus sp. PS3-40]|uniref:DUF1294 domain-containing protein n=1 Tax=Neobacillus sp. PS3-40 TaxID=3070679 RepID=UPI0027E057F9|nr:DUF1294 domain-containing protein [Neobacillus sp. PS3-40]WML45612.1 DUF1294 domain-containing protein [Neobacillus sp. PS3-40]